jgi:hypothetical protein
MFTLPAQFNLNRRATLYFLEETGLNTIANALRTLLGTYPGKCSESLHVINV